MTIKTRNRMNFFFFLLSTLFLAVSIFHVLFISIQTEQFLLQPFLVSISEANIIFGSNSFAPIIAIFFELSYTTVVSLILYRVFSKTQSSIVVFFLLFLLSISCDTARIFIIFNQFSGIHSQFLLLIGNITLFGRILAPLSLLLVGLMTFDEQLQDTNRNCMILLITALFFSFIIPVNTAKIRPNFCFFFSFPEIINILCGFIVIINFVSLLIFNLKNNNSQKTTIGITLVSIAYPILFNCTSFFKLALGIILLSVGSPLYLKQLHNEYLWR